MGKKIELKVTSAFMWDGKMRTAGSTITLAERDAKRLLDRGKAEIASGAVAEGGDEGDDKAAPKSKPAAKSKAAKAGGGDGAKNPEGGAGEGDGGAPEA